MKIAFLSIVALVGGCHDGVRISRHGCTNGAVRDGVREGPRSWRPGNFGGRCHASARYIVGPGDSLQVFVWRNPDLSVTVPVRPDGRISTPLVEDMLAIGKTPAQLARDIEKVLSEYVRSPQVNVIVSAPVSTFSQVKIIGHVAKPQALAFREGLTVLDAVLSAGGLEPFAAAIAPRSYAAKAASSGKSRSGWTICSARATCARTIRCCRGCWWFPNPGSDA